MAEVAETATEVVADAAEEVAEVAEHVAEVSRGMDPRDLRLLFTGLGVGTVGGLLLGGFIAMRRLESKYRELAESEIDEMREHFRKRLVAKEEKPDLAVEASKIAEREGYSTPQTPVQEVKGETTSEVAIEEKVVEQEIEVEETEVEAPETEVNLFEETTTHADEGWDYEEEHRLRRPDRPYIIHVDEQHEKDYAESTLTYYAGDDVLCDERDNPVDDKEKVVGEGNLDKFGHGSHDPNILYIRNDVLQIEVEVIKNDGTYAEVVHGFVQHSDNPHHRGRPRFDDEPDAA